MITKHDYLNIALRASRSSSVKGASPLEIAGTEGEGEGGADASAGGGARSLGITRSYNRQNLHESEIRVTSLNIEFCILGDHAIFQP